MSAPRKSPDLEVVSISMIIFQGFIIYHINYRNYKCHGILLDPLQQRLQPASRTFTVGVEIKHHIARCSFSTLNPSSDQPLSLLQPHQLHLGWELLLYISLQLSCYAMYSQDKWRVKPENIRLIEYNLLSDQKAEFTITFLQQLA